MDHQQIADLGTAEQARQHHTAILLGKDIARFAQRPGHHRQPRWPVQAVARQHRHGVEAAVHRRPHQLAEAGIDQHEVIAAGILGCAHLAEQRTRLGHQEATGFDLQRQRVADQGFGGLARGVPLTEIMPGVDHRFAIAVRNRQAAAGRNRLQVMAGSDGLAHQADHRTADFAQMAIVDA